MTLVPCWRCEGCNHWEPRYERAVNAIPHCPHCIGEWRTYTGSHRYRRSSFFNPRTRLTDVGIHNVRMWEAVRCDV